MKMSLTVLCGTLFLTAGLATAPAWASDANDAHRLALALEHSTEVDHANFKPRTGRSAFATSWEVLGERQILIWHGQNKAWLVGLRESQACRKLDKQHSIATSSAVDSLNVRNGYIVSNAGTCYIESLRKVDVAAMREAEALAQL